MIIFPFIAYIRLCRIHILISSTKHNGSTFLAVVMRNFLGFAS
jgi:hypothetical protein